MLRCLVGAMRDQGTNEILEDVVLEPLDVIGDLESFCDKLNDEAFKKNGESLSALCGHNVGDSTRCIMAKLGTNKLWPLYGLKGKKGKLVFKNLSLCKVIKRACMRVHVKASEIDVEEHLAECLKHAPHKPGGSRFKIREARNDRPQTQEHQNEERGHDMQ